MTLSDPFAKVVLLVIAVALVVLAGVGVIRIIRPEKSDFEKFFEKGLEAQAARQANFARLDADEGMVAAMNSAIAIYYSKHNGNFPEHPGKYVRNPPPKFLCSSTGFEYSYDAKTGIITVTVRNVANC